MCFIKLQDHKKPWLLSVLNHEKHEKTRKTTENAMRFHLLSLF